MSRQRVALVWAGDPYAPTPNIESTRLAAIGRALSTVGLEPVGIAYADEIVDSVEPQLSTCDAVLVWVNPIERGGDRTVLNALLRRLADQGAFVSAHPDVIDAIGTKEVLYHTRDMGWGSDVRLYATSDHFTRDFPTALTTSGSRVLKQCRGNGGNGVWKVTLADEASLDADTPLLLRHAARGGAEEPTTLAELVQRFEPYFERGGTLIDQEYQSRIVDGTVRCYLAGNRVMGFGEQKINALYPAPGDGGAPPEPGPRLYFPPTREDFQPLKRKLESQWLPELCARHELAEHALPVIWDADFFYGAESDRDPTSFVLCEINVSAVFPIPDECLQPLAELARTRLEHVRNARR